MFQPNFKNVCLKMGLFEDEKEWNQSLEEASIIKIIKKLRRLFDIIFL